MVLFDNGTHFILICNNHKYIYKYIAKENISSEQAMTKIVSILRRYTIVT